MNYYLISTAHLEDRVLFRDDEDFKVAMNAVALYAALFGIRVLAFILMSNHMHFVFYGHRIDAEHFINELKRHYSRFFQHKYGIKELLRRNEVDIKLIENVEEALERVIAYVQMNCVAANICIHPWAYSWGTGKCFFAESRRNGVLLETLSQNQRQNLMRSRLPVSGKLVLGEDGYILPESYVDVQGVEALYKTPKRMNYFLHSSSKSRRVLEDDSNSPAFKDQTILPAVTDLCYSLFQKRQFSELKTEQQAEVLKQLRYRFSANVHQLSRVCGSSYEDVARLLDSM